LWTNLFKGWQNTESQTVMTLKQVPIFRGLTNKEFREIEKLIHERTYKPQEIIFKQQARGEGMYIILSGEVEIYLEDDKGNKNILAVLRDGEFFGELSLLDAEERSATAAATKNTILLGFFRPDLLSLMERNAELGNKILLNLARVTSARLRKTNELLTEAQKS